MSLSTFAASFALVGFVWAAAALTRQVCAVRRGRDHAVRAGVPARGVIYNFTVAMLPGHKESIRLHRVEFLAGVILHVGVVLGLVEAALWVAWPSWAALGPLYLWPVSVVSLIVGVGLLVRRVASPLMRALSAPEDYLAICATCLLVGSAALARLGGAFESAFLIYTGLLLIYLPLGKLRHAVFFFVARGEYGARLGYRGVYPPPAVEAE